MKIKDTSFDEYDEHLNPKPALNDFDRLFDIDITRRDLLKRILVTGSLATLAACDGVVLPDSSSAVTTDGGSDVAAPDSIATDPIATDPVEIDEAAENVVTERFNFNAIDANSLDDITVPEGYSAQVVARWGDPLFSDAVEFDQATRGNASSQARAFGDNIDGMEVFAHGDKILLVVNNEYTNRSIIWGNRTGDDLVNADDVNKAKAAHGLTIVEIAQAQNGLWNIVKDSNFNRRVTPDTPMQMTGPAAGHSLLRTLADPAGINPIGTYNNCGRGVTPWGTYLACEENFNGYFSTNNPLHEVSAELRRYGVSAEGIGYGWAVVDDRFDVRLNPNEPNRFGYVVEIDPRLPNATPKKRSALGRFKHENAEVVVNDDGRIVVYMGDDERGEFLYRYVSNGVYVPGGETDSLLEDGRLYVAKFFDTGRGEWRELTPESTGMASMAEVCIHTRIAASTVGATTMDRPEWVAANPNAAEVYCSLTNNSTRGVAPNAGGDLTPVGGPNPRAQNRYGQIVRWQPSGSDHTRVEFDWDLFVVAGNPVVHSDALSSSPAGSSAGSSNITAQNMFNSPDGISFDSTGLLWIQTDGNDSNEGLYAGHGNNQMLAGDPLTGEIRRFMVGPNDCEITGLTWSPDKRTMFVGIQHPGESGNSHWPGGGNTVPRSAVVAVTRDDGLEVG